MRLTFALGVFCILFLVSLPQQSQAESEMPKLVQNLEGVSEYRLSNGLQVLLFPDDSKPTVTVNMTVFVGSRHEGYGEAGMAHLLEHMLFKGTELNPDIPKALKTRGAQFNGTTWVDRTNYYESMNASDDNLEFAISLEADRLVNSKVRGEDLATEMSVVRSEFERGEDSPGRVIQQRMMSAAFQWHNYGKSTIGNRSDIERVPIDALRRFYKKYYRPDNVMLVVAGKFDPKQALELTNKYFGILENPNTPLDQTYTVEPPQDGERTTVVRRVGDSQLVGVLYHVPAGSDPTFAAVDVLGTILADEPGGRLYKALVETKKATSVYGGTMAMHDPGVMFFLAEVAKDKSIEDARQTMIETLESLKDNPITQVEVDRCRQQLLKARELTASNITTLAIELSEWASQGDWRLYFLHRDRLESVTVADVQKAADYYLVSQNRTVGLYIPTEKSERLQVPDRMDVKSMLAEYKGREAVSQGEAFENTPDNIQKRTINGELNANFPYALVPKKSRGSSVQLVLNLRFGNEDALFNKTVACDMLGGILGRGSQDYTYQELRDKLDSLFANVSFSSQAQLLSVRVETKSDKLIEVLGVIESVLRRPSFDAKEFAVIKDETIVGLQTQLSDPNALAPTYVARELNQKPRGHVHYVPTIEEEIEDYKAATVDQVRDLYQQQLNGQRGELAVVGQCEPDAVIAAVKKIVDGWNSDVPYVRVDRTANLAAKGELKIIETPDKANSMYYAQEQFSMKDSSAKYPALLMGNYILGGGALSSRLGDRVRQNEGLSYGVASGVTASPIDERTVFTIYAISNPAKREKLTSVIAEEVQKLVSDGVTEEELKRAIDGYLQSTQVSRAEDRGLVGLLSVNLFAKRDMMFVKAQEEAIRSLTVAEVNAAIKEFIDPARLVIATAGDFANAETAVPAGN
jgi:zinc protease